MENFKEQISNILFDLKQNYALFGLKAEFEAEGAVFDEVLFLKEISKSLNLSLSVKISGSEAMRDLYELKKINPDIITAPVIESSYAAFRFSDAVLRVFNGPGVKVPEKYLGIETEVGFKNLDEILSRNLSETTGEIDGIVVGRSDLAASINFYKSFKGSKKVSVDSDIILNYASLGGQIVKKYGKKLIIGGFVTEKSTPFFKKLNDDKNIRFDGFETRKTVFGEKAIEINDINKGILKALEFEILWLKNRIKKEYGTDEDKKRLDDILKRYYDYKR